ncbi:hypothetical protein [Loktanella sp. SALINAS62]|uniref:hypothetical protein n=1 Tax=Loktanella sp. SALINAS62 TaxID=2706124 RepID=UPI001B8B9537|nr:hypothetical protein [Loktanella sp. SALINAS62]MBS1301014.1 hypothetical protein [Loktanella sp. SALINAS62]
MLRTTAIMLCLAAAPVLAQDLFVNVQNDMILPGFPFDAELAEGLDVVDDSGNQVGTVRQVIGPDAASPEAFAIDFAQDMVADGDTERVVPLTALTFDESVMVMADTSDIANLPVWQYE